MVETIIQAMRSVAAPGREDLDATSRGQLKELTARLLEIRWEDAISEYERFLSVTKREICLPKDRLMGRLEGRVILVTGGTGCVGTHLIGQLTDYNPARIVSVSRGVLQDWPPHPDVEYRHADLADRACIEELTSEVKPDVIFHTAAQRFPGLAEIQVADTVRTIVMGTRNVLSAAAKASVQQVVVASTGKALRPFSPDIYTASKRIAEWVTHGYVASGELSCSAVRFTHVVNNSDIHKRLKEWADSSSLVRLHSPEIMFYVQSATECAQLLLLASLDSQPGELRIHALADLGWPVSLLDLALGALASRGSDAPIYLSGYEQGYEEIPFPGLYDPMTAGEVSPLINAFEASALVDPCCLTTNAFTADMISDPQAAQGFADLEAVCSNEVDDQEAARAALRDLSWSVLDASAGAVPTPLLNKIARMVERHEAALTLDHRRILNVIRDQVKTRETAASQGCAN